MAGLAQLPWKFCFRPNNRTQSQVCQQACAKRWTVALDPLCGDFAGARGAVKGTMDGMIVLDRCEWLTWHGYE